MGEPFNTARWIKDIKWPEGLNCYSFAANCKEPMGTGLTACLPGAKAGFPLKRMFERKALVDACIADGFDYTGWAGGPQPTCQQTHYLVAVFIDKVNLFHFARQREDRQWVHKPSAAQDPHNMQGGYLLGTDLSNVPWQPFTLITYLCAPWAGVAVAKGDFAKS